MEYNLRFNDSDLRRDVIELLEKTLREEEDLLIMPHLSQEEISRCLEEATEEMKKQGNRAPYRGLVLYVTEIALKKAHESH